MKNLFLVQKKDKSDPFKGYVVCCDHTLVPNIFERYMILDNNCPQSTWKPSEEDKKKFNRIYMLLAEAADEHAYSTTCRLIGDKECVELQDFLKSLLPQNQWKPSEEQIKAVRLARSFVTDDFDENPTLSDVLVELEKQLKKLKGE